MNEPDTPARLAKTRPLAVANARRATQPGCALRLDRTSLDNPLGRVGPIHTFE